MENINSTMLRMLQRAGKDPHSHHDWIRSWRLLHDELEKQSDSSPGFSEIEHAALSSISSLTISETHTHLTSEVSQMLNTFKHPAFLVDSGGRITAQNVMGRVTYDIDTGNNIGELPVVLKKAESVEDVVREVTKSRFLKGKAVFKQALSQGSTHELTLAITKSEVEGNSTALVFIISSTFSKKSAEFVKSNYELTIAECEVLSSFVEGFSLREIASNRERSYATIRTQFNAVMAKMGAHSQASLLRTALSLSDFNDEMNKFSAVIEHPFRRPANIMLQGGRMVDVCFCGDPTGTPMLHIACVGSNRFNANVEKSLYEAGVYLITVCPPAHGKTDPAPSDSNRKQCKADDIEAVLNLLNIDHCPLLAMVSGTYSAFDLAVSIPNRISQILLVASCPPGDYWKRHGTGAPWIDAIFRIDAKFPSVRKLIAAANLKALITLGLMQWYKHQLVDNKKDIETLMQPENIVEVEYGQQSATTFGMKTILEDVPVIFTDYSEMISQSSCNVSIIHGDADPINPIESMREFQANNPERVKLFEIKDAGFTLLLSHTEEAVKLMSNIVNDAEIGQTNKTDSSSSRHSFSV